MIVIIIVVRIHSCVLSKNFVPRLSRLYRRPIFHTGTVEGSSYDSYLRQFLALESDTARCECVIASKLKRNESNEERAQSLPTMIVVLLCYYFLLTKIIKKKRVGIFLKSCARDHNTYISPKTRLYRATNPIHRQMCIESYSCSLHISCANGHYVNVKKKTVWKETKRS